MAIFYLFYLIGYITIQAIFWIIRISFFLLIELPFEIYEHWPRKQIRR